MPETDVAPAVGPLQDFLAAALLKGADDLAAAFLALPADKRDWKPGEKARTALDQVAECATTNRFVAELLAARAWTDAAYEAYGPDKAAAQRSPEDAVSALRAHTGTLIDVVRSLPDDAWGVSLDTPWGAQTLAEMARYAPWNMAYHEGQINYIASLLPE